MTYYKHHIKSLLLVFMLLVFTCIAMGNVENGLKVSSVSIEPLPWKMQNAIGNIRILFHVKYIDRYQEHNNTLSAINQYFLDWEGFETDTLDPDVLRNQLKDKNIFFLTQQEQGSISQITAMGNLFASVLHDFVESGGLVIECNEWESYQGFMNASGLMYFTYRGYSSYGTADVFEPNHSLCTGLGTTVQLDNSTSYFDTNGKKLISYSDHSILSSRDIGLGHIVLIGYDYYEYNDDAARIVANAVMWGAGPPSPTPTPNFDLGVQIDMRTHPHPGSSFWINGYLINNGPPIENIDVYFAMQYCSTIWFWPTWTPNCAGYGGVDCVRMTIPQGGKIIEVTPETIWPDTGQDVLSDLLFFGAMVDPRESMILGQFDVVSWGFSP